MAKPRILQRFTLKEISIVDRPAVQDGVVAADPQAPGHAGQEGRGSMTSEAQRPPAHHRHCRQRGHGIKSCAGGLHRNGWRSVIRIQWCASVVAGRLGWLWAIVTALPDVSRIVARLLESDPVAPDLDPEPEVGKGDSIDTPMTSIVGGHCHVVALAKDDGFALHTSGSGTGEDSHTHKVSKRSDGSYQVEPGADGHTHTLPGSPDALRKALKGSDPLSAAPESTENPTMTETAFEKSRRLAKAIEKDMDTLAEECRVDFPELSREQAFAKMLRSVKGEELWTQHRELEQEAQLSKSDAQLNFEAKCEARIDVLVKAATGKWASPAETKAVRSRVSGEFYGGSEFEAMQAEYTAAQVAKHAPPEPELECIQAGLLTKAEIEADPEAALDRLAAQVAWRDSISKAQAVARFAEPGSIGHEVLQKAYAAENARSDAATNG